MFGVDDRRVGAEPDEQCDDSDVAAPRGFVERRRAVAGVDVEAERDEQLDRRRSLHLGRPGDQVAAFGASTVQEPGIATQRIVHRGAVAGEARPDEPTEDVDAGGVGADGGEHRRDLEVAMEHRTGVRAAAAVAGVGAGLVRVGAAAEQ